MDGTVVMGFLDVIVISLAPCVLIWVVLHLSAIGSGLRRAMIRLHVWRRPPLAPAGPPLEQLAADLRRLYPDAHFPRPGVRMPKQRGVLMAYDARLVATAQALQIATTLTDLPIAGFDREAERLRVEHALSTAGIVWQVAQTLPDDPAA